MRHYLRPIVVFMTVGLAPVLGIPAENEVPAVPGPKPLCSATEFRQFDFWVGDWVVRDAEGAVVGSNRVERVLDGCALWEQWTGAGASRGFSYNIYSKNRGHWHQTWVDNQGRLLELDGGLEAGSMVLRGENPGPEGGTVRHEIRWTPLEDGRVRQHWRFSADGGASWKEAFEGFYELR